MVMVSSYNSITMVKKVMRIPGQVPGKAKLTIYIKEEVARELRVEAAYQGRRQSALVEEAIREYLKRFKKGKEVKHGGQG